MPKEYARSERVAQMINRHLAMILRTEVRDPRVSGLTITDVEVTKDLRQAKVFVSSMLSENVDVAGILSALDSANGFLRRKLANAIEMRHCPSLVFAYDSSIADGAKMSALIDQALNKSD